MVSQKMKVLLLVVATIFFINLHLVNLRMSHSSGENEEEDAVKAVQQLGNEMDWEGGDDAQDGEQDKLHDGIHSSLPSVNFTKTKHFGNNKFDILRSSHKKKKTVVVTEKKKDDCKDKHYRISSYRCVVCGLLDLALRVLPSNPLALSPLATPPLPTLHTQPPSRFHVGKRKDFQSSISDALGDLGMCKARDKKTQHDFVWDKTFDIFGEEKERERYHSDKIKDGAIVSSIPGVRENLGLKPSLARVHDACLKRHRNHRHGEDEVCSFTKRAFNFERDKHTLTLEGGIKQFSEYVYGLTKKYGEQQWPQLWIFKPQESFLGQGIKMLKVDKGDVSDRRGISNWAGRMFPNGQWTLQEYVRNPAVYSGRKFDVRVWSVLLSLSPLRIYTLEHGFAKISTVEYSPAVETMDDLCMHVKMPLGPGCKAMNLVKPYPKKTLGKAWEGKLEFSGTAREVEWKKDMWSQVEDQVTIAIMSGLANVKAREWEMFDGDREAINRYRRFVFVSPDFAFDNQGKVWMEEMNTNGFMIGDTYEDFFPAQDSTIQLLQLLGADKFPDRWKYHEPMEAVIDMFCGEIMGSCEAAERSELERMVHEEMHSHQKWSRTWPPRENQWPGMGKVAQFWDQYKSLIAPDKKGEEWHGNGEPTELDILTWKFIEYRWKHTLGAGEGEVDEEKKKLITKTCIYCTKDETGRGTMHRKWWD